MFRHYGVEAGRDTIIKEVKTVFGVYGIGVNFRHLSLVADYMVRWRLPHHRRQMGAGGRAASQALAHACLCVCVSRLFQSFEGEYHGMNRVSMRSSSSPFKRMSFESTTDFLRAATLTGEHDELTVREGQGCCWVLLFFVVYVHWVQMPLTRAHPYHVLPLLSLLQSSSSRLVVGRVTPGGTGLCDLMQPLVLER